MLVIFGFKYKDAVVLSLCTVLGNYMSQVYINWKRAHPLMPSRPLIYFELVMVFIPAQLGGNNIGVIFAKIFPETILLLIAMIVVIYALVKTVKKGLYLYQKETIAINSNQYDPDEHLKKPLTLDGFRDSDAYSSARNEDDIDYDDEALARPHHLFTGTETTNVLHGKREYDPVPVSDEPLRLDKYLLRNDQKHRLANTCGPLPTTNSKLDSSQAAGSNASAGLRLFDYSRDSFSSLMPVVAYDYNVLYSLVAVWVVYGAVYVTMQVSATVCSDEYYGLLAASFLPLLITVYFGIRYVKGNQEEDPHLVLEGDLDFSKLTFIPSVLAFLIGILCSLLGIGGGELMGPLLLSLQILPLVSSATTSFMSFMSSSSNILHYAIQGRIDYKWGLLTFAIGMFGGILGRSLALYLVARYKRASITTFALASILCISVVLLAYDIGSGKIDLKMHYFCRD